MFLLNQKIALITGAGQGMGYGIAQTLAAQGARVVINDLNQSRAQTAAQSLHEQGYEALAIAADVTNLNAVEQMVKQIKQQWGSVEILVNNAGIPADGMVPTLFREMPIEDWDRYLDLNLKGVLHCVKTVLDDMCDKQQGRIINIVSESWRNSDGMGISLYAAAKAGTVGFSRQLAGEVGKNNVTVNCISLGLMNNVPGMDAMAKHFPIKRLGNADDAAAAICYLASDEAGWVTGQCIPINGGIITA